MHHIQLNTKFLKGSIDAGKFLFKIKDAGRVRDLLHNKKGAGSEFLGWVDLPAKISDSEISSIKETAKRIRKESEYLVVVGIGGSYLGARAAIEGSINPFANLGKTKKSVKVIYAGHHIDADYHNALLSFLEDKDFSVNVISKSGTTTEPALAFRSLLDLLKYKYGKKKLKDRVISTTDREKGALKKLSDEYGFQTFVIPDDVGGRYSVLTPVGLLPIACAGIDIQEFVYGAKTAAEALGKEGDPEKNLACLYAAYRNSLYEAGKKIEVMVNYNPALHYFTEWWKQLYGESEGKGKKGIFPAGVDFTSDLHSMGQYIQDGERHLFETVINVGMPLNDLVIGEVDGDPDGLNYISGKSLNYVTQKAILGTMLAHYEGGVPCMELSVPKLTPETMGELIYFFEYACGISGYMLGVNPFDQPGVEDYKNNVFALLGKKGYEETGAKIQKSLSELK